MNGLSELFIFVIDGYIGDDEDRSFTMKTTAADETEALAQVYKRASAAFDVDVAELTIKSVSAVLN